MVRFLGVWVWQSLVCFRIRHMHRHIGMPQESMCGIFPEVLSVAAIPIINKSEVLYEKSWFSMVYMVLCFMDHLGAEFISKIFSLQSLRDSIRGDLKNCRELHINQSPLEPPTMRIEAACLVDRCHTHPAPTTNGLLIWVLVVEYSLKGR